MSSENIDLDAPDSPGDVPAEARLSLFKRRFKAAQEAEQKQREREKDDLKFQVPELQWDDSAKAQRLGWAVDGVPTPARPVLSVSKIDQPIQLVLNQERAAKLGVSIQPVSPDAQTETAAIFEGIYRRIERDSQAHLARSWAFERAVKCGRGWYRVNTVWDESSDNDFDQKIVIERILHQDSVYADPSSTKPDFSDGEWLFVVEWMPLTQFKREYPEAESDPDDELAWNDLVREAPEWVRGEGENRAVLVAEHWWKEHKYTKVKKGKYTRTKDEVTVYCAHMTAFEILEQYEHNGHHIPLIPVIGRELIPFDEQRYWTGIIGPAKDSQRGFNYSMSQAVESAALEPRAPFIGADGQFEGHESEWQQANTRNWPYLEYTMVTGPNGELAPPPQRMQADSSKLTLSLQLSEMFNQGLQSTTSIYDPGLGRTNGRERSGKAIEALQGQGDQAMSHFMHNLADISMAYEARVILDLIPAIYDRPERVLHILDAEDKPEAVMLNTPYYNDPRTKRPTPLQPGQQPPMLPPPAQGNPPTPGAPAPPGPPGAAPPPPLGGPGPAPSMPPPMPPAFAPVKHYDLTKGKYNVAISIGKTRQSALQEGAEEIQQILQAQPQLAAVVLPFWLKFREFPGAKELGDMLAKLRDKQFPGLFTEADGQPTPEQQTAQIQGLQGQLQQVQQQLQMAIEQIKTEQAKQQAVIAKAQIDSETKLKIAEMEQQTKILLESLMGKLDQIAAATQQQHERETQATDQAHEAALSAADAATAQAGMAAPDLTWKAPNPMPLEAPPGGKEI